MVVASPVDSLIYYSHVDTLKMAQYIESNNILFSLNNKFEIGKYFKLNFLIDRLNEEEAIKRLKLMEKSTTLIPGFIQTEIDLIKIHCQINREDYQQAFTLINQTMSKAQFDNQKVRLMEEAGRIYSLLGDYAKAEFYYLQAIRFAHLHSGDYLIEAYIELASLALDKQDLVLAEKYLRFAEKHIAQSNNPLNYIRLLHYQGDLSLRQNDQAKAFIAFQSLANYALSNNYIYYYGLVSIDLANIYLTQNRINESINVLKKALVVAADEPNCKPNIYKKLGEIFVHINLNKSIGYYKLAQSWAVRNNNNNILNQIHVELYSLYKQKGDLESAIHHLNEKIAYDSLKYINLSQKSVNELNLKIVTLTESLKSREKENIVLETNRRIADERFLMSIIVFLLLFLSITGLLSITYYHRKKSVQLKKIHTAQLLKITEDLKEKISKELHDNIGNELVILIHSLSKSNSVESEKIKQILEQLRDISKNLYPNYLRIWGFIPSVRNLCNLITAKSGVTVFFNCEDDDYNMTDDLKINLYRVLQECFTNSIKHSSANFIKLEIFLENGFLNINYQDNGDHFNVKKLEKGMGLSFIEQRILFFSGTINYFNSPSNGFGLKISIPLMKRNSRANFTILRKLINKHVNEISTSENYNIKLKK